MPVMARPIPNMPGSTATLRNLGEVVLYRYVLNLREVEGGLSVSNLRQYTRCLHTLGLVPFSRNFAICYQQL